MSAESPNMFDDSMPSSTVPAASELHLSQTLSSNAWREPILAVILCAVSVFFQALLNLLMLRIV